VFSGRNNELLYRFTYQSSGFVGVMAVHFRDKQKDNGGKGQKIR